MGKRWYRGVNVPYQVCKMGRKADDGQKRVTASGRAKGHSVKEVAEFARFSPFQSQVTNFLSSELTILQTI